MRITKRALLIVAAALAACALDTRGDEAAIASMMRAMFERRGAPLDAGPIVIDGDYAVADWTQGEMGGRALLERRADGWAIVLCAGDVLRTEAGVQSVGVPAPHAQRLARALAARERDVPTDRLAAMARFEGIVRM